jgi:hypothetical protein
MHPPRAQRDPIVGPDQIECWPSDMTFMAGADVTAGALRLELERHNQWLPIDADPALSLGRLVETNTAGPLRLGYGTWRDLLTGCQFINGRDELITAGGATMKNVAGYDLTKLMVGQRGTLGRIATITSRSYIRPDAALIARFAPREALLCELLPTPARPQWAMLDRAALWCGYLGDRAMIDFVANHLRSFEPAGQWQMSPDEESARRGELWRTTYCGPFVRAIVPPASIERFTGDLSGAWVADAAFGVVKVAPPYDLAMIRDGARCVGGSCYVEGPDAQIEVDAATATILRRLKTAFDPDGRLARLNLMIVASHGGGAVE